MLAIHECTTTSLGDRKSVDFSWYNQLSHLSIIATKYVITEAINSVCQRPPSLRDCFLRDDDLIIN